MALEILFVIVTLSAFGSMASTSSSFAHRHGVAHRRNIDIDAIIFHRAKNYVDDQLQTYLDEFRESCFCSEFLEEISKQVRDLKHDLIQEKKRNKELVLQIRAIESILEYSAIEKIESVVNLKKVKALNQGRQLRDSSRIPPGFWNATVEDGINGQPEEEKKGRKKGAKGDNKSKLLDRQELRKLFGNLIGKVNLNSDNICRLSEEMQSILQTDTLYCSSVPIK